MRIVDLFTGTGGFSTAFKIVDEKNETVFFNDIKDTSQKIINVNFPNENFYLKDIHDVKIEEIPDHDVLTGGFPCQPFSIAGKREGWKDSRSNVFWKIIEILENKKPTYFILENVKNLTTHDEGKTFSTIISSLEEIGYMIKYKILDTSKITSIPQHRERIYIVGCNKESSRIKNFEEKFSLDFPTIPCTPLLSFLESDVNKKYYYTEKLKVFDMVRNSVIKENTVYQYRRTFVRENKSGVCPTLTENMGSGGHNVPLILDKGDVRKLTPRECFNLQGFPSSYILPKLSDSALYSLAGNAISVPVVALIAKQLMF